MPSLNCFVVAAKQFGNFLVKRCRGSLSQHRSEEKLCPYTLEIRLII